MVFSKVDSRGILGRRGLWKDVLVVMCKIAYCLPRLLDELC